MVKVRHIRTVLISNRNYPDKDGVGVFIDAHYSNEDMERLLKLLRDRGLEFEAEQIWCG